MLFDTTAQITLFSLILMRMSGFILLNPILGRRNIPMQVKAGFIFILTVTVYSFSTGDAFDITNPLEYGLLLFKEFAAGYAIGFVTELFFFVITFAGYVMDFQMGMSMSTVYDPQSNAQVPITGVLCIVVLCGGRTSGFDEDFADIGGDRALRRDSSDAGACVPDGRVVFRVRGTRDQVCISGSGG